MNLNKNLLFWLLCISSSKQMLHPPFAYQKHRFWCLTSFSNFFHQKEEKREKAQKFWSSLGENIAVLFFTKFLILSLHYMGICHFWSFFLIFELFWTYKWPLSSLFYRTKKCRSKEKRGGALSIRLKKSFGRTKKPLKRGYILWD